MAANDYLFVTHWRVKGTCEEVYAVLIAGREYVRWWPDVYLDVVQTKAGGEHGIGKEADVYTKGKLPYRLRWHSRVIETDYPHGYTLEATGDFVGCGTWRFEQQEDEVAIRFDWQLRAEKPLLRTLSFLLKPVFRANHRWAMARGESGLRAELARRRQSAVAQRSG